jgi:hypothetical protein
MKPTTDEELAVHMAFSKYYDSNPTQFHFLQDGTPDSETMELIKNFARRIHSSSGSEVPVDEYINWALEMLASITEDQE